jgi:hypothetical protein
VSYGHLERDGEGERGAGGESRAPSSVSSGREVNASATID